jgi:hypothetical protein
MLAGQGTSRCTGTRRWLLPSRYMVTLAFTRLGTVVLGDLAGPRSPYGTAFGFKAWGSLWAPTPQLVSPVVDTPASPSTTSADLRRPAFWLPAGRGLPACLGPSVCLNTVWRHRRGEG